MSSERSNRAEPAPGAPLISVVVASVNGPESLATCLRALLAQDTVRVYEVVVADRCGAAVSDLLRSLDDSRIHSIEAPSSSSIPYLRALAMAIARGQLVAILEDHCTVRPNWIELVAGAYEAGHVVIGGAVENGRTARARDWAAFLCEYSAFLPPLEHGSAEAITGNNSVYERRLLEDLGVALDGEVWESFLHEQIAAAGVELYCEADLVVSHDKSFDFFYFFSQRFHYSRSFAAMRVDGWPQWKRWLYALLTPALPPVLLFRMIGHLKAKPQYRPQFFRALPLILIYLIPWAFGEAVGAVAGAGNSLARVE
jgi:glycosyltransferase involved in cell wall biosynthesis